MLHTAIINLYNVLMPRCRVVNGQFVCNAERHGDEHLLPCFIIQLGYCFTK